MPRGEGQADSGWRGVAGTRTAAGRASTRWTEGRGVAGRDGGRPQGGWRCALGRRRAARRQCGRSIPRAVASYSRTRTGRSGCLLVVGLMFLWAASEFGGYSLVVGLGSSDTIRF